MTWITIIGLVIAVPFYRWIFSDVGGRRAPTKRQRARMDWDTETAAWLDMEQRKNA